MAGLTDSQPAGDRVMDAGIPGVADVRALPNAGFSNEWASIVLPAGMKEHLLRTVIAGVRLRPAVPFPELPLHGVLLLTGPPGVGKTTLARGLADKVARTARGAKPWTFVEIDPHELASSSLGRSQRGVSQLFGSVLQEHAAAGPLIVLFDEVETVFTDRRALSLEANPVDVHRAVDAALVGLDQLARRHRDVLIIATSNYRRRHRPGAGVPRRQHLRGAAAGHRCPPDDPGADHRGGRRGLPGSPATPRSAVPWTLPPVRRKGSTAAACARPWLLRARYPRKRRGDPGPGVRR